MDLVIRINLDSAAFEGAPHVEAARILRGLVREIDTNGSDGLDNLPRKLVDVNGNAVGTAKVVGK